MKTAAAMTCLAIAVSCSKEEPGIEQVENRSDLYEQTAVLNELSDRLASVDFNGINSALRALNLADDDEIDPQFSVETGIVRIPYWFTSPKRAISLFGRILISAIWGEEGNDFVGFSFKNGVVSTAVTDSCTYCLKLDRCRIAGRPGDTPAIGRNATVEIFKDDEMLLSAEFTKEIPTLPLVNILRGCLDVNTELVLSNEANGELVRYSYARYGAARETFTTVNIMDGMLGSDFHCENIRAMRSAIRELLSAEISGLTEDECMDFADEWNENVTESVSLFDAPFCDVKMNYRPLAEGSELYKPVIVLYVGDVESENGLTISEFEDLFGISIIEEIISMITGGDGDEGEDDDWE